MHNKIYLHFYSVSKRNCPKDGQKRNGLTWKEKNNTEEHKTQYEKNQFLLELVLSNQQTEKCQPLTL